MTREEAEKLVLERMWKEMPADMRREDAFRMPLAVEWERAYLETMEGQARIVTTLTQAILDDSGIPRAFVRWAEWLARQCERWTRS